MPTSIHTNDVIDQWILHDSLRITGLHFDSDTQQLTIEMSTKASITFPLSAFPSFLNASLQARSNFSITGDGIGVHWLDLDEDLSLKGFLLADLKRRVLS